MSRKQLDAVPRTSYTPLVVAQNQLCYVFSRTLPEYSFFCSFLFIRAVFSSPKIARAAASAPTYKQPTRESHKSISDSLLTPPSSPEPSSSTLPMSLDSQTWLLLLHPRLTLSSLFSLSFCFVLFCFVYCPSCASSHFIFSSYF